MIKVKKFIKEHKKQCLIGGAIFLVIFLIIMIWLFVIPLFSNNKYGDRLEGIDKHKISSSTIDDIKNTIKENKQVNEVTYHSEGRILNFIINVSADMKKEDAKALDDIILDKISKENQSYYDIQILIDTDEENQNYPIAGYKNKAQEDFVYGNEAESSE